MKMELFRYDDDDGGLRNQILAQMVGSPRLQDWPPQTAFPKPTLLQKEFFLELFFLQSMEIVRHVLNRLCSFCS